MEFLLFVPSKQTDHSIVLGVLGARAIILIYLNVLEEYLLCRRLTRKQGDKWPMFFFDPCPHISVQAIKNRGMEERTDSIMRKNIKETRRMRGKYLPNRDFTIPWKGCRTRKQSAPVPGF